MAWAAWHIFGSDIFLTNLTYLTRFREGSSFPNFVCGEISPELPPSKLCAVPFALHLSREEKGAKRRQERGGRGVASKGGEKEKRTRENRSVLERKLGSLG